MELIPVARDIWRGQTLVNTVTNIRVPLRRVIFRLHLSLSLRGFVLRGFANLRGCPKNKCTSLGPCSGKEHQNCSTIRTSFQHSSFRYWMEVNGLLHALAALLPRQVPPDTHWIGDWMGFTDGLDAGREKSLPLTGIETGFLRRPGRGPVIKTTL